jgi:glycosyltransferase involved in cell wall biosynthesis
MTRVLQIVIAPHIEKGKEGISIGITGPERRSANLIGFWKGRGITPVVCYPKRGNLRKIFIDAGVKVIDFEVGDKFNLFAALDVKKLIRENNIDVVHTQGPASLDIWTAIGGWLASVPVVITRPVMIEDQIHYTLLKRFIYSWIDRLITLKLAKHIVAVSGVGLDHLKNFCKVNPTKLQLIYNGVDLSSFSPKQSTKYDGSADMPPVTLGMVAQLFAPKGWYDFIDVIERLSKESVNIRALIVGEGEMRQALEAEVKNRGLDSTIIFTGFTDNVAKLYEEEIDIFLFTTHREGLSVAVIETLASGLPLVCTDVGGIKEQIDEGKNGYIVGVGDFDLMVKHCLKLINNPELRAEMGVLSREIALEKFSEERMLDEYEVCYKSMASLIN